MWGTRMILIAGPCSVEGANFIEIAKSVKKSGATHLRGGLFKPRSSPFRWHGYGLDVIEFVQEAKRITGLPYVCEVMSAAQIELLYPYVDWFQIGTRNATNTELLKEVGRSDKPVLYKRGMAQTVEEFVMGADFILNEGNPDVFLCERGIRTFETYTRNTFDVNCIAAVKTLTHLPIIADPSHGTGRAELVLPVACSGIAAGADGLIVEVHDDPKAAMTDAEQSITCEEFAILAEKARKVWGVVHE